MKGNGAPETPSPAGSAPQTKVQPKLEVVFTNSGHYISKNSVLAARAAAQSNPPTAASIFASQGGGGDPGGTGVVKESPKLLPTEGGSGKNPATGQPGSKGPTRLQQASFPNILPSFVPNESMSNHGEQHEIQGSSETGQETHGMFNTRTSGGKKGDNTKLGLKGPKPNLQNQQTPLETRLKKRKVNKPGFEQDTPFFTPQPGYYSTDPQYNEQPFYEWNEQYYPETYDPNAGSYDNFEYPVGYEDGQISYPQDFSYSDPQQYPADQQPDYGQGLFQTPGTFETSVGTAAHPPGPKKRKGKTQVGQMLSADGSIPQDWELPAPGQTENTPADQSSAPKGDFQKDSLTKTVDIMNQQRRYDEKVKQLSEELTTRGISLKILMKIDPQVFSATCASDIAKIQKQLSSGAKLDEKRISSQMSHMQNRLRYAENELNRIRASCLDYQETGSGNLGYQNSILPANSQSVDGWNYPPQPVPKNAPHQSLPAVVGVQNSMWGKTPAYQSPPSTYQSKPNNPGRLHTPVTTSPIKLPMSATPQAVTSSQITTGNYGTYILKPSKTQVHAPVQPVDTSTMNNTKVFDELLSPAVDAGSAVAELFGNSVSPNQAGEDRKKPNRLRLPDPQQTNFIHGMMAGSPNPMDGQISILAHLKQGTNLPNGANPVVGEHSEQPTGKASVIDTSVPATPYAVSEAYQGSHLPSWNEYASPARMGTPPSNFLDSGISTVGERGPMGKGFVNKVVPDQGTLRNAGRPGFNLFSKPAPTGGDRILFKGGKAKNGGSYSGSNRGAETESTNLADPQVPQEQQIENNFQNIAEEQYEEYQDSYAPQTPEQGYQYGESANNYFGDYGNSSNVGQRSHPANYNTTSNTSNEIQEEQYYSEHYASEPGMIDMTYHGDGAGYSSVYSQNAQFGTTMDRNSHYGEPSLEQSAYEREQDDYASYHEGHPSDFETPYPDHLYPDGPNQEPCEIENTYDNHASSEAVNPQASSAQDSRGNRLEGEKEPNGSTIKQDDPSQSVDNSVRTSKQQTDQRINTQPNTRTPDNVSREPTIYALEANQPAVTDYHPQADLHVGTQSQDQVSSEPISEPKPEEKKLNKQVNENAEVQTQDGTCNRPMSQKPLSGNGNLMVREEAPPTPSTATNSHSVAQQKETSVKPASVQQPSKRQAPVAVANQNREWTKEEASRLKQAGAKAAEAIRRCCSKALETAASKRQHRRSTESMLSQLSNPKKLPLHELCMDPEYSSSIQRWLNKAKEAERVEFLYDLKPYLQHVAIDYIGKFLLHTLFTMSKILTTQISRQ